jgi:G3E family GTPase
MAAESRRLPVVVVSGFLGSGKTTLIRRLLRDPRAGEVAVIVNEFGEIGLDHHLVRTTDERTILLSHGCVCCSLRDDLAEALRDLLSRRDRGAIPRFDRVVIETTGLADPAPLLQTIRADPVARHHFAIERVIVTVDAVSGASNLARYGESLKQVAVADHLVITKGDLAPESVPALAARLRRLNPLATIGPPDLDALLESPVNRVAAGAEPAADDSPRADDHLSRGGIRTWSVTLDEPLNWQMFGIWLSLLLHRHGERVLRLKGLLNTGGRGPVVVQGVQHVIHAPQHLAAWPDADRRSGLVLIVRDLDPARIEESLRVFQRAAGVALPATQGAAEGGS